MSVSETPNQQPDDVATRDLSLPARPQMRDIASCPPNDQLAQLVCGSLAEMEADQLFQHIDRCSACQKTSDELARRRDPVLAAAQDAKKKANADLVDPLLSKLIRDAQLGGAEQDTRSAPNSATKTVSAADFLKGLKRSGLMEEGEVNQVLSEISWDEEGQNSDVSSLAKLLIENRKLTRFQAKLLLRGRWQGLVLGNYAILEKLGQGGMGAVFKARHTRMGRTVCLKVVNSAGRQSPAVIERFRHEARTLAALSHPNIVVAHDANEAKGIPYLVMEYIDGDDLARRVRRDGPLSPARALKVVIQSASALQYAHAAGVIHRDVKPHNLVASEDEATGHLSVKVLDLGLARFDTLMTNNPDASVLAAMTNTGVVIGTVDYMAPEQALDSRNADARSDIYSLGCTMYFLLTGRPPYQGDTVMQRLIAHREQSPPSLCDYSGIDISPALDTVVQKTLAKDPDARYQTMDELLDDLHAVAAGREPTATLIVDPLTAELSEVAPLPAHLAIQVEEQAAQVVSRILTRRRSKKNAAWYRRPVVAASAALGVMLLAAALFMLIRDPGAATAIRHGGNGRALVMVSSDNFREDEFRKLAEVFAKDNVQLVAASPNYGTGKKDHGSDLKASFANLNFSQVKPADFDAIFVLGGSCILESDEEKKVVKEIILTASKNNVEIAGSNEGYQAIMATSIPQQHEFKRRTYHKTHNAKDLANTANKIFSDLRSKKK